MPKGVPNKRYTPEFKKLVIETMQEEKLSYSETCRRFEVKPTTEKTLHTEAAEGKAEAAKEPKKATKKETVKKTIKKETTETMAEATKTPRKMTKVSDTVLEIFETKVSMKDLEAVIKKEVKANGLKGEIKIYLNAEQRAAYYTVDGQGSDDFKVDLTTLAE